MKYKNTKKIVNGIVFDSKREANRYAELYILEKAGEIKDLKMQVPFVLIPTQYDKDIVTKRGKIKRGKTLERACVYIADFVYQTKDGETVVEDTKGCKTKDYIIKRKLMLYVHGIKIQEV